MIDARLLLVDLQRLLPRLEDDLRARVQAPDAQPTHQALRAEWQSERDAGRTADAFAVWLDAWLTQVAVAWLLSLVFVRYLEDNALVRPYLAGPGARGHAADELRQIYIRDNPHHSDADFLRHVVFEKVGGLPAAAGLFGPHNLARALAPSGDLARALLEFFARAPAEADAAPGALAHDFGDMRGDTRFLGDLYQDLSEAARSRYALLQTPDFVEAFILDHTLAPALDTFGLLDFRVIDPTCGSGHFLLGAFERLLDAWLARAPETATPDLVQRALDAVWGVDLNPFAVAIARFRLLLAAMEACGAETLASDKAPNFTLHVCVADSLLAAPVHGTLFAALGESLYSAEDPAAVNATFGQSYHAVVGNPPYITVKDKALNAEYRKRFPVSCHRQYSLGVPFTEQFFALAVRGGFVGMITANSFMKREFGKPLIEKVLPELDLTHVVDTSGAFIPGHGTPTVILLGRHQERSSDTIRAVLGIRGEPSTPSDPAQGRVWRSIADHLHDEGFENAFVSVVDAPEERYKTHPWSLQGGGAADVKATLESVAKRTLAAEIESVGFMCITRADDAYVYPPSALPRFGLNARERVRYQAGESVRDWSVEENAEAIFPYTLSAEVVSDPSEHPWYRLLWPHQSRLWERREPNGSHRETGLTWYEWSRFIQARYQSPLLLTYAFVATHNHFVLDRGGKVFNRHAPVIKLPADATEDDHLALLGLLNSSTACFWMKQVFQAKASGINDISTDKNRPENDRYEFAATGLQAMPIPAGVESLLALTRALDELASQRRDNHAGEHLAAWAEEGATASLSERLAQAAAEDERIFLRMVLLQEELDWLVYGLFGLVTADRASALTDDPAIGIRPDQRPFAWSGDTPPDDLPHPLRTQYVQRRALLRDRKLQIRLIETAVFKRPWLGRQGVYGRHRGDYLDKAGEAAASWLLDRLESPAYVPHADREHPPTDPPALINTAHLAEQAAADAPFMAVAQVYAGRDDFDVVELVTALVLTEAAPALPALRFKATGQRKHAVWQQVWALQRREDAGETLDEPIPVPPKYTSADFADAVSWRMRGKLDVPKERFVVYPYAAADTDRGAWVTWAGLNHLQRALAVAAAYLQRKDLEGWAPEALLPFLAELDALVPWLRQWHNEPDAQFGGERLGDYYAAFVQQEAHALGTTLQAARKWAPARKAGRRGGRPRTGRAKEARG